MNDVKKLISLATIIVVVLCGRSNGTEFSLNAVIDSATNKHSKIHQYRERIDAKKYDVKSATGNYMPSLTLSGSFNRINDPLTINLDPIREAMIGLEASDIVQMESIKAKLAGGSYIVNNSQLYNTYYTAAVSTLDNKIPHFVDTLKDVQYPSLSVTLVQPLFTGFKITAGRKAAKADLEVSLNEYKKIQNELIRDIAVNYINLIVEKNAVQIRTDVLDGMMKHMKRAQSLSENGMISANQVLRAKVAVAEAQRNLDFELNRMELLSVTMNMICCIDDTGKIVPKQQLTYTVVTDSLEKIITLALENHPVFGMLDNNYIMAKQKNIASKAVLYPQVNAFGKYELFKDYLSAMEPQWIVGVQASLPLFSGGKNIAAIHASSHTVNEVHQMKLSAQRDITLLINKHYREMKSSENRYLHLESDIELANENLFQCKSRFESGYGTSLEIIDAELVLEKNRMERTAALGEYYKSIVELYTAAGLPFVSVNLIEGSTGK
jgi:outer membrane protein TolC